MPANHLWSPIADLPADYTSLTDGELASLTEVWKEQREELADTEALKTFQTQLHRRWAIETGVIEGAYSLDRGVTETLILKGIDANLIRSGSTNKDPDEVAAMIEDHLQVLEGLFTFVDGGRELTVSFIKELHAALLRRVRTHTVMDSLGNLSERELVKGAFKTVPNNPSRPDGSVHRYCPPEHVDAEMDSLIRLHGEHRHVPPEIEAAWLHHAFTQIHPFSDGNGRVARAIASVVFIKAGLFPMLITRDEKGYVPALERADAGDLSSFVRLLVSGQRQRVLDAVHSIPPAAPRFLDSVDKQILAAREQLIAKGKETGFEDWSVARKTARFLEHDATLRFSQLARQLTSELGKSSGWKFTGEQTTLTFSKTPHSAVLSFQIKEPSPHFRGFLLGDVEYGGKPINDEPFQINYKEDQSKTQARFATWLERAVVQALALWREQL